MDYRNSQKIAHDLGTAVNVVTMVFEAWATTRRVSRSPAAEHRREVALRRVPHQCPGRGRGGGGAGIAQMQTDMPEVYAGLPAHRPAARAPLPRRGTSSSRSNAAGCTCFRRGRQADRGRSRADRCRHGRGRPHLEGQWRGSSRPTSTSSCALRSPGRAPGRHEDRQRTQRLARRGRWAGRVRPTRPSRWVDRGEKVILVRIETSPDDFHGMAVSQGIITARGGATSHAAVVARQIGKPCVAGSSDLLVDYAGKQAHCSVTGTEFKEGDWVSLDGSTGALYLGQLPTVEARFEDQPELQTILGWADGIRRMQVWTNADKPEEAARARGYGAQGIGLCAEHMFREGERLEIVRDAILVMTRRPAPRRRPRRARRSTPTSRRRSPPSTPRWRSSSSSSRATSRGSSRRWTACRSSSGSSIRRCTSSSRTSRNSWSRSPGRSPRAGRATRTRSYSRRSSRSTSRTRCWACAAAVSDCCSRIS